MQVSIWISIGPKAVRNTAHPPCFFYSTNDSCFFGSNEGSIEKDGIDFRKPLRRYTSQEGFAQKMKVCDVFSAMEKQPRWILPRELLWLIAGYVASSFDVNISRSVARRKYVDEFAAGYLAAEVEKSKYIYVDRSGDSHTLRVARSWLLPVVTKGNLLLTCIDSLKSGVVTIACYMMTPDSEMHQTWRREVTGQTGPVRFLTLSHDDRFLCVANTLLAEWSFFILDLDTWMVVSQHTSRMKPLFLPGRNAVCRLDGKTGGMEVLTPCAGDTASSSWKGKPIETMLPSTIQRYMIDAVAIDEHHAVMPELPSRKSLVIVSCGVVVGHLPNPARCVGVYDLRWVKDGRLLWCAKEAQSEHMISVVYTLRSSDIMPGHKNSVPSDVSLTRRFPLCALLRRYKPESDSTTMSEVDSGSGIGTPTTKGCAFEAVIEPSFYVDTHPERHRRAKAALDDVAARMSLGRDDRLQASDDWSVVLAHKPNKTQEHKTLVVMTKEDGTRRSGFIDDAGLLHRVCSGGAFAILSPTQAKATVYTLTIARGHSKVWPWKDPTKMVFALDVGYVVNAVDVDSNMKYCSVTSFDAGRYYLCVFELPQQETSSQTVLKRMVHQEFAVGAAATLHGFVPKPFGDDSSEDIIVVLKATNAPKQYNRFDGSRGFQQSAAYAELGDAPCFVLFTDVGMFCASLLDSTVQVLFKGFDVNDRAMLVYRDTNSSAAAPTNHVILHKHDVSVLAGIDIVLVTNTEDVKARLRLVHVKVKWELLSARLLCFSGSKRMDGSSESTRPRRVPEDTKIPPDEKTLAIASASGSTSGSGGAPAIYPSPASASASSSTHANKGSEGGTKDQKALVTIGKVSDAVPKLNMTIEGPFVRRYGAYRCDGSSFDSLGDNWHLIWFNADASVHVMERNQDYNNEEELFDYVFVSHTINGCEIAHFEKGRAIRFHGNTAYVITYSRESNKPDPKKVAVEELILLPLSGRIEGKIAAKTKRWEFAISENEALRWWQKSPISGDLFFVTEPAFSVNGMTRVGRCGDDGVVFIQKIAFDIVPPEILCFVPGTEDLIMLDTQSKTEVVYSRNRLSGDKMVTMDVFRVPVRDVRDTFVRSDGLVLVRDATRSPGILGYPEGKTEDEEKKHEFVFVFVPFATEEPSTTKSFRVAKSQDIGVSLLAGMDHRIEHENMYGSSAGDGDVITAVVNDRYPVAQNLTVKRKGICFHFQFNSTASAATGPKRLADSTSAKEDSVSELKREVNAAIGTSLSAGGVLPDLAKMIASYTTPGWTLKHTEPPFRPLLSMPLSRMLRPSNLDAKLTGDPLGQLYMMDDRFRYVEQSVRPVDLDDDDDDEDSLWDWIDTDNAVFVVRRLMPDTADAQISISRREKLRGDAIRPGQIVAAEEKAIVLSLQDIAKALSAKIYDDHKPPQDYQVVPKEEFEQRYANLVSQLGKSVEPVVFMDVVKENEPTFWNAPRVQMSTDGSRLLLYVNAMRKSTTWETFGKLACIAQDDDDEDEPEYERRMDLFVLSYPDLKLIRMLDWQNLDAKFIDGTRDIVISNTRYKDRDGYSTPEPLFVGHQSGDVLLWGPTSAIVLDPSFALRHVVYGTEERDGTIIDPAPPHSASEPVFAAGRLEPGYTILFGRKLRELWWMTTDVEYFGVTDQITLSKRKMRTGHGANGVTGAPKRRPSGDTKDYKDYKHTTDVEMDDDDDANADRSLEAAGIVSPRRVPASASASGSGNAVARRPSSYVARPVASASGSGSGGAPAIYPPSSIASASASASGSGEQLAVYPSPTSIPSASASASGSGGAPAIYPSPTSLVPSATASLQAPKVADTKPKPFTPDSLARARRDALNQLQKQGGVSDYDALSTIASYLDTTPKLKMTVEGPFERYWGRTRCDGNQFSDTDIFWETSTLHSCSPDASVRVLERQNNEDKTFRIADYVFVSHAIDGAEVVEVRKKAWLPKYSGEYPLAIIDQTKTEDTKITTVIREWKFIPPEMRSEDHILADGRTWTVVLNEDERIIWIGICPLSDQLVFTTTITNARDELVRATWYQMRDERTILWRAIIPGTYHDYWIEGFFPGTDDIIVDLADKDGPVWNYARMRLRNDAIVVKETAQFVMDDDVWKTWVRSDGLVVGRYMADDAIDTTLTFIPFVMVNDEFRLSTELGQQQHFKVRNPDPQGAGFVHDKMYGSASDGMTIVALVRESKSAEWVSIRMESIKTFGKRDGLATGPRRPSDSGSNEEKPFKRSFETETALVKEVKSRLATELPNNVPSELAGLMASYTTPHWQLRELSPKRDRIFRPLFALGPGDTARPWNLDFNVSYRKSDNAFFSMDDRFRYVKQFITSDAHLSWGWTLANEALFVVLFSRMNTSEAQVSVLRRRQRERKDLKPGAIFEPEEKATVIPCHTIGQALLQKLNASFKQPNEYQLVSVEEFDRRHANLVIEMKTLKEDAKAVSKVKFIMDDAPTTWETLRVKLSSDSARMTCVLKVSRPLTVWRTFGRLACVEASTKTENASLTNLVVFSFPELTVIRSIDGEDFGHMFITGTRDFFIGSETNRFFDRDGYLTPEPMFDVPDDDTEARKRLTLLILGPYSAIVETKGEYRLVPYGTRLSEGERIKEYIYDEDSPVDAWGRLEPGYTIIMGDIDAQINEVSRMTYFGVTDQITLSKRTSKTATGAPKRRLDDGDHKDYKHTSPMNSDDDADELLMAAGIISPRPAVASASASGSSSAVVRRAPSAINASASGSGGRPALYPSPATILPASASASASGSGGAPAIYPSPSASASSTKAMTIADTKQKALPPDALQRARHAALMQLQDQGGVSDYNALSTIASFLDTTPKLKMTVEGPFERFWGYKRCDGNHFGAPFDIGSHSTLHSCNPDGSVRIIQSTTADDDDDDAFNVANYAFVSHAIDGAEVAEVRKHAWIPEGDGVNLLAIVDQKKTRQSETKVTIREWKFVSAELRSEDHIVVDGRSWIPILPEGERIVWIGICPISDQLTYITDTSHIASQDALQLHWYKIRSDGTILDDSVIPDPYTAYDFVGFFPGTDDLIAVFVDDDTWAYARLTLKNGSIIIKETSTLAIDREFHTWIRNDGLVLARHSSENAVAMTLTFIPFVMTANDQRKLTLDVGQHQQLDVRQPDAEYIAAFEKRFVGSAADGMSIVAFQRQTKSAEWVSIRLESIQTFGKRSGLSTAPRRPAESGVAGDDQRTTKKGPTLAETTLSQEVKTRLRADLPQNVPRELTDLMTSYMAPHWSLREMSPKTDRIFRPLLQLDSGPPLECSDLDLKLSFIESENLLFSMDDRFRYVKQSIAPDDIDDEEDDEAFDWYDTEEAIFAVRFRMMNSPDAQISISRRRKHIGSEIQPGAIVAAEETPIVIECQTVGQELNILMAKTMKRPDGYQLVSRDEFERWVASLSNEMKKLNEKQPETSRITFIPDDSAQTTWSIHCVTMSQDGTRLMFYLEAQRPMVAWKTAGRLACVDDSENVAAKLSGLFILSFPDLKIRRWMIMQEDLDLQFINGTRDFFVHSTDFRYLDRRDYTSPEPMFAFRDDDTKEQKEWYPLLLGPASAIVLHENVYRHVTYGTRLSEGERVTKHVYAKDSRLIGYGRLEPGYTIVIGAIDRQTENVIHMDYFGVTDQITLAKRNSHGTVTGAPKKRTHLVGDQKDNKHSNATLSSASASGSGGLPAIVGPPATFALGGVSTQPLPPTTTSGPPQLQVSMQGPFVDLLATHDSDGVAYCPDARLVFVSWDLSIRIFSSMVSFGGKRYFVVAHTADCRTAIHELKIAGDLRVFNISYTEAVVMTHQTDKNNLFVIRWLPELERATDRVFEVLDVSYRVPLSLDNLISIHVNEAKTWMLVAHNMNLWLQPLPPIENTWGVVAAHVGMRPLGFLPGSKTNEFVYLLYPADGSDVSLHRVDVPDELASTKSGPIRIPKSKFTLTLRSRGWFRSYKSHNPLRKDGALLFEITESGTARANFISFVASDTKLDDNDGTNPPLHLQAISYNSQCFGSAEDGRMIVFDALSFRIDGYRAEKTIPAVTAPRRNRRQFENDTKTVDSKAVTKTSDVLSSGGLPAVQAIPDIREETESRPPPNLRVHPSVAPAISANTVVKRAIQHELPAVPRDLVSLITSYTSATWKIVPIASDLVPRPILIASDGRLLTSPDLSFGARFVSDTNTLMIYEKDEQCRIVEGKLHPAHEEVALWNRGILSVALDKNSLDVHVIVAPLSTTGPAQIDSQKTSTRKMNPITHYNEWNEMHVGTERETADSKSKSDAALRKLVAIQRATSVHVSSDGALLVMELNMIRENSETVQCMEIVSLADLRCIAFVVEGDEHPIEFIYGTHDLVTLDVDIKAVWRRRRSADRYATASTLVEAPDDKSDITIPYATLFGEHSCVFATSRGDVREIKYADRSVGEPLLHLPHGIQIGNRPLLRGNIATGSIFVAFIGSMYDSPISSVHYWAVTDSLTLANRLTAHTAGSRGNTRAPTHRLNPQQVGGQPQALVVTGDVAQQSSLRHTQAVAFTPVLNLVDAGSNRPEIGGFSLVMQMQYPYIRRASDRSRFDSASQQTFEIRLPAPLPHNATAMMSLMMRRKTDEGLVCQYRLAACELELSLLASKDPISLVLFNVNHEKQGTLVLTPAVTNPKLVFGPDAKEFTENPQFVQFYDRAHETGNIPPCGPVARLFRRTHVPYLLGAMTPVWMIANIRDRNVKTAISDAFLLNALEHTVRWTGFKDPGEWAATKTGQKQYEVLAQVCGFYPWLSRYLYDQTWDRSNKRYEVFEQFSCLREKLDMKTAAGDCEDFSHDMCLVCMALIEREPKEYSKGSAMRKLINMARYYVPFIVDASIYNGSKKLTHPPRNDSPSGGSAPGVDLHMYVQLIPRHLVQKMVDNAGNPYNIKISDPIADKKSQDMPILSLESTEPCISNWRENTDARNDFLRAIHRMKTIDGKTPHHREGERTPTRKAWAKMSVHTTKESFMNDQFYRLDLCAYSPLLYRYEGFHHTFLMCEAVSGKAVSFGVDKTKWMQFDKTTTDLAMVPLPAASEDERKTLQQLEDRAPMRMDVKLDTPLKVEYTAETKATGEIFRVYARAVDWTAEDDRLVRDSAKADGVYEIVGGAFVTIRIMNDVDVIMYPFAKRASTSNGSTDAVVKTCQRHETLTEMFPVPKKPIQSIDDIPDPLAVCIRTTAASDIKRQEGLERSIHTILDAKDVARAKQFLVDSISDLELLKMHSRLPTNLSDLISLANS